MKRIAVAVVALFISISAIAQTTHRYVVGVRRSLDRVSIARQAVAERGDFPVRRFRDFEHIDAFAADLSETEAADLQKDARVRYVEQATQVYAFQTPAARPPFRAAPAARNPNGQTTPGGISLVGAPDTWAASRGDTINVAVVDTGIDYTHPDLKDVYAGGYNAVLENNDPRDDNGHGTHVSGTIAAEDNAIGVVGVAPHARIWAVKVLGSDGSGSTATIADGFNWVINKKKEIGGNWIINLSLGICSDPTNQNCARTAPKVLLDACNSAADNGVLVFAAAGNDSLPDAPAPVSYPAAIPGVVAVGAIDSSDAVADFSNQGPELAVVAPGVDILSTVPVGSAPNTFVARGTTVFAASAIRGSKLDTVSGIPVFCSFGRVGGDFPLSVKGNIAVMERGFNVTFNQKTKNALQAGATAVVIYNCSAVVSPDTCTNDSPFDNWTLITTLAGGAQDPDDLSFAWPVAMGVAKATGDALREKAGTAITLTNALDDYDVMSGTSMACPHAVGVAALVWAAAPNASATQIKQALLDNAHHLGADGTNKVYGHGAVDALTTTEAIAPQLFGPAAGPRQPTGRRLLKRGH